jgi:Uma2 family endonuclease
MYDAAHRAGNPELSVVHACAASRNLSRNVMRGMVMGLQQEKLTLQTFLDWENLQPQRHEFYRGEVFGMTGGRRSHGCVTANLVRHLGNQLAGTPCRVFSESMKIQIADDTILYPDIFVTCDRQDLQTEMIFRSPTLVLEVLSPSTQAYDRSQKFALYRRLPSLTEYGLIDPESRRAEIFRINADRQFVLFDMSESETLELTSIGCKVAIADVFDGIDITS